MVGMKRSREEHVEKIIIEASKKKTTVDNDTFVAALHPYSSKALRYLVKIFPAIEFALCSHSRFNTMPFFTSIQEHLHQSGLDLSHRQMAQILGVCPELFEYSYITSGKKRQLLIKQKGNRNQKERSEKFLKCCNEATQLAFKNVEEEMEQNGVQLSSTALLLRMEDFVVPEVTEYPCRDFSSKLE